MQNCGTRDQSIDKMDKKQQNHMFINERPDKCMCSHRPTVHKYSYIYIYAIDMPDHSLIHFCGSYRMFIWILREHLTHTKTIFPYTGFSDSNKNKSNILKSSKPSDLLKSQ